LAAFYSGLQTLEEALNIFIAAQSQHQEVLERIRVLSLEESKTTTALAELKSMQSARALQIEQQHKHTMQGLQKEISEAAGELEDLRRELVIIKDDIRSSPIVARRMVQEAAEAERALQNAAMDDLIAERDQLQNSVNQLRATFTALQQSVTATLSAIHGATNG